MARSNYSVEVIGYVDEQTGMYKAFISANEATDVTTVDVHWDTGSVLWDVTNSKWYGLDSSGQWVEQE